MILLILTIALAVIGVLAVIIAWRIREDALDYLWEARKAIARNNAILRKRVDPIELDGSLNPVFFTKELIEVVNET
jgi:hypothetical protein